MENYYTIYSGYHNKYLDILLLYYLLIGKMFSIIGTNTKFNETFIKNWGPQKLGGSPYIGIEYISRRG